MGNELHFTLGIGHFPLTIEEALQHSLIQRACEAVGLVCPDICTPAELMKL
jgi:hypothetical protein